MDTKQEIPDEIRSFLESLLSDAGMTTLDDTMRQEMINELYVRLDNFLTGIIIDNMPAEHVETFIKMNEDNKPKEEIENFLKDKLPNSQDVLTRAFGEFRSLYLGNVTVARSEPEEPNESNSSDAAS